MNDDVCEYALDSALDLDVTVDVFTEDILETVDCLVDSTIFSLMLSVNCAAGGDVADEDKNVCVVKLGTALILDVKLDVFTEEIFDTVESFVESKEPCLVLSSMLNSAAVADDNAGEGMLGTALILDVNVDDVIEELCEPEDPIAE